jgi:hypothetical protein
MGVRQKKLLPNENIFSEKHFELHTQFIFLTFVMFPRHAGKHNQMFARFEKS